MGNRKKSPKGYFFVNIFPCFLLYKGKKEENVIFTEKALKIDSFLKHKSFFGISKAGFMFYNI